MKLTVLADNNTFIDQYYLGEPAVSYYIEDEGTCILFDTGYSDAFITNARLMKINLTDIDVIAISHGHNDHTRGLKYLCKQVAFKGKSIIAHPNAFKERDIEGLSIGCPVAEDELNKHFKVTLSKETLQISEHITFLGEIPTLNDFENRQVIGQIHNSCGCHDDVVNDDTALVYKDKNGLFIITGCSHSGVCNIIEYAKQVCGDERIQGVIGGFHLFDVSPQVTRTIDYLNKNKIKELYPCHCVSFAVKAEIHKHIPIHEVGVGMVVCMGNS